MSDRFLFVRPLKPGDLLADLVNSIDDYGRLLGCRFVLMVADTGGEEQPQEQEAAIEEEPEVEAEEEASDDGLRVVRRQTGSCIFVGDPLFPSNDDLAAIRSEIGKMGQQAATILAVNSNYGEVELMANVANESATIYSTFNADDESKEEEQRRMIFDHNTKIAGDKIRKVPLANLLGVRENQNIEVLILIDPKPGDFEAFSRHLKHGGLLMLVSTTGAPPDRPEVLADKFRELTPCVLTHYRQVDNAK